MEKRLCPLCRSEDFEFVKHMHTEEIDLLTYLPTTVDWDSYFCEKCRYWYAIIDEKEPRDDTEKDKNTPLFLTEGLKLDAPRYRERSRGRIGEDSANKRIRLVREMYKRAWESLDTHRGIVWAGVQMGTIPQEMKDESIAFFCIETVRLEMARAGGNLQVLTQIGTTKHKIKQKLREWELEPKNNVLCFFFSHCLEELGKVEREVINHCFP